MSKRAEFLGSVCRENVEDFLRFIQLHKDPTEPFDVGEVLQELPRDQKEALWGRLASLLQGVLLELHPDFWEGLPAKGRGHTEEEGPADPKWSVWVVEAVTLVCRASLEVLQPGDSLSALLEVATLLHDVLVELPVCDSAPQLQIQLLCEACWKKGILGKEMFGRTALLHVLQRSFTLKKAGPEIQRVWELHSVLLDLDFSSEDNKQIIDLLLQCFITLQYIRHDDGKRFLVFLFSWSVDFISMIHGVVKNQLQFFNKSLVTHIAEVYFRAWRKASGDFLEKMETSCLQDLMQNCILLHRKSPVLPKARQIVSFFHKRKGDQNVDKMLHHLYKPILWRALSAPNFEVRANAALLFTEAFAVHDPTQSDVDATIQKQLDAIMVLLDDPHPVVRSTAALGVCRVLATCWEMLPRTVITDFLKKLVVELSADANSADVRCSVFKCLTMVLDNALSHPLLEKLLPALRNGLHDVSEKVRTAFLDMLLKVKAVRAAKFWDVCTMDHLLARLAVDSLPVCKRLVTLLFKSFFPVNESEGEWCLRCVSLIQMNPSAARRFYQLAYLHTTPTNIVKLMLSIRRALNSCIQTEVESTQLDDSNKENSSVESLLSAKDSVITAGLLEVLVILWKSVEKPLQKNQKALHYTVAKFSSVFSKYLNTFEDERCKVPLVLLASIMPAAAVPTFSCGVLSKLRRMDPAAERSDFGQLIDCMCSWRKISEVLELITDWLTEALPTSTKKAGAGRKVQIQQAVEAQPDLGLSYLDYLLSSSSGRESVLEGPAALGRLHRALGTWRSLLFSRLSPSEPHPSVRTALKALELEGRLSVHLQHHSPEGRDSLLALENMAAWVAKGALRFLVSAADAQGEVALQLARDTVESFLSLCRDVLLVGLGDDAFKGETLRLCSMILVTEKGFLSIPLLLCVLKEVTESLVRDEPNQQEVQGALLGVVANAFQKTVELLALRLRKDPEEGKALCQASSSALSDFLQVVLMWAGLPSNPLDGVFSTLFAAVIVENRHKLQKISHPEDLVVPHQVEQLPALSSILMEVVLRSPQVTRLFLSEIVSSLDSESIDCLTLLAAALHVLSVISHTSGCRSDVRRAALSVQKRLQQNVATPSNAAQHRTIYESSLETLSSILSS